MGMHSAFVKRGLAAVAEQYAYSSARAEIVIEWAASGTLPLCGYAAAPARSRMLYHGPDWSFLGWISAYFTVMGIGLLKLRKWALLLSFLPAIAILVPFAIAWHRNRSLTMPVILLEVSYIGVMIIVPGILLRSWRLLKW
jgi:hypothetical protein